MSAYPRVETYLARLPDGARSYPECVAKASAYREALGQRPLPSPGGLPEELAALVRSPVPLNAWIPEVQSMALALAVADWERMEDREFLGWIYDHNRGLLSSPTYRYLMAGDSPAAMLKHAHVRWRQMHRGVRLEAEEIGEAGCRFAMRFPPHLYDELLLRAFAQTFRAGLDLTGTPKAEVALLDWGAESARFAAHW